MIETYLIYNLILISSTFFVFLYERSEKSTAWIFLSISFFIITIPAALRYNIGIDYRSYQEIFENIRLGGDTGKVEIGYLWLNNLVIALGLDFQWFIAFISFLIFILAYASYPKKYATVYHIAYFTVYYLITYNAIRSAIVFGLALLAITRYLKTSKIIPFVILSCIGALFHKSSLLILIIPVLSNKWFTYLAYKYRNIILISFTMIFIWRSQIIEMILTSQLTTLMGYGNYINNMYFTRKAEINSGFGIILRIMPLLFVLIYSRAIIKNNHTRGTIVIAMSTICLGTAIFASTIDIFLRLERVYYFAYILIPLIFLNTKNIKQRNIIALVIITVQIITFELFIYKAQSHLCSGSRIAPYVSIFNKVDDRSTKIPGHECFK